MTLFFQSEQGSQKEWSIIVDYYFYKFVYNLKDQAQSLEAFVLGMQLKLFSKNISNFPSKMRPT